MKTENNGSQEIAKLSNRNLISFSVGTIGRDMVVVLFFVHLINYILFAKSLTSAQFTAITLIMAISMIIDAINDPIMGNILDTTHTRWGKFKPWIAAGMISTVLVVIASLAPCLQFPLFSVSACIFLVSPPSIFSGGCFPSMNHRRVQSRKKNNRPRRKALIFNL